MKWLFNPRPIFLMVCVIFVGASSLGAVIQNQAVVRAVRDGSADVSLNGGKSWKRAEVGMKLGQGAVVRTDNTATVDLFLGDNGPVVRVTKGTTLRIDKLDLENTGIEKVIETQLDLTAGRILGNVKKLAAASKYEVKTPRGVAGIRGTEYSISADGTVTVISGTVVVVYVGGWPQPVIVQAGYQVTPPSANGMPPVVTPASFPVDDGYCICLVEEVIVPEPRKYVETPFDLTGTPLTEIGREPAPPPVVIIDR